MTRVRILHFIDTLGAGGAERQLVYLVENLDRERFDCHVLTTYDSFRHYEDTLRQLDIPIHSLHHGALIPLGRAGAAARYVQLMWVLKPQIVHSWLHYPNLIGRIARPLCPSHQLITAVRTEYTPRQQSIEQFTLWMSNFRVVNTHPTTKSHFKVNTFHIPNGVPIPPQRPRSPQSSTFTALMVARIDPRKDHLTLLRALNHLDKETKQNLNIVLIGEITDQATQAQIDSTIRQLNLASLVQQLPPTHDIAPHYAAADVTILPSSTEGFSNVILESFAAAKPIIVAQAADSAGLVKHGVNGWVFPTGDSLELATQIESAYHTPQHHRTQMGRDGRAIAEQYSIQRMVEQYTLLYERALNRS